ncbi:MAG: helix-turn-helix domain-containing protein [Candidatus Omnitrophota bacterium]
MGVIYKLKPEIKDFIVEQKRSNPALSCRKLSVLVEQKYQIKLSKSSINLIIKTAGLSMPVGRRSRVPKPSSVGKTPEIQKIDTVVEEESTGAVLLKAMDSLIGGSRYISEAVRKALREPEQDILAKTEALIYFLLFSPSQPEEKKVVTTLSSLSDRKVSPEDALSYLDLLQSVNIKSADIYMGILGLSQQVRGVKLFLADNKNLYLDSRFHTLWPTPYIPYDFSTTIYNTKSYINRYFFQGQPLTFFNAPGEDTPSEEFFSLISALNSQGNKIERVLLYGNNFEELQSLRLGQLKRRLFIFGLLPGQFRGCRTIKKTAEFKSFFFEPLQKELCLAETEVDLLQPSINQVVTLKGCLLKTSLSEPPCLIILGNNYYEGGGPALLANTYLSRWPNLQEARQDFNRKVEFFSYTGDGQGFSPAKNLNLSLLDASGVKPLFNAYIELLDLYFRQFFLPAEFNGKVLPTIKEEFYELKTTLRKEKSLVFITFHIPDGFSSQGALEYACRRLNEREIEFSDGRRAWFII